MLGSFALRFGAYEYDFLPERSPAIWDATEMAVIMSR
jgi:hypothetical protein